MTERKLHWRIELHRNGRLWSWSVFGYRSPNAIGCVRNTMSFFPRLSQEAAERRANRAVDRIERRGFEDVTL